jgi:hypothetical protein
MAMAPATLRGADEADQPIDMNRAKELMLRRQAGETLTLDDNAYLIRALQYRRQQARRTAQPAPTSTNAIPQRVGNPAGLVPLTELSAAYKGEDGGLYGGGKNEAPAVHQAAYVRESAKIRPLNAQGEPADDGKIGLVGHGFSNTFMEFTDFKRTADQDPQKSPRVVVVNGAIGGRMALMWAADGADLLPAAEQQRLDEAQKKFAQAHGAGGKRPGGNTWTTLDDRLKSAGLAAPQVQVMWMKHVEAYPEAFGVYPDHAKLLEADLVAILNIAKQHFPNLRVVYLSSRTYGGWSIQDGSPEPYAYETAFAVRAVIQRQIKGDPRLNFDPARGPVTAPLVLWGPYLWAHGDTPRKSDGMVWKESDTIEKDRKHPSLSGCRKVTELLLKLFKTDPAAQVWFTAAK